MKHFNILSPQVNVVDHFFLEASAGTGKTFAIEHLVARLIMEGYRAADMLIVTFTRAATRDLRQRVCKNLQTILSLISNQKEGIFPYLDDLLKQEPAQVQQAILRLKRAIHEQQNFQIFTIHGFCYRMLKRFAFEAKVPLELLDPDESSSQSLYIDFIIKQLRIGLDSEYVANAQLQLLMRFYKKNLNQLILGLLPFMQPEVTTDLEKYQFHNLYDTFNRLFEDWRLSNGLHLLERMLPYYKGVLTRSKEVKEEYKNQLILLEKAIEDKKLSSAQFEKLLLFDSSVFQVVKTQNRKKLNKAESDKEVFFDQLERQIEPLSEKVNQAKSIEKILASIGSLCKKRFESEKKEREIVLTDHLLEQMLMSLLYPQFAKRVKELFSVVIVDEFQDTDPKQWNIFESLFLKKDPIDVFCVVGDPKQSIYSFRFADLQTYFKAKSNFKVDQRHALKVNYRSSAALIEGLNVLFKKMPSWLDYYEVESGAAKAFALKDQKQDIHFFGNTFPSTKQKKWPSVEVEYECYRYILEEIKHLHANGISFDSICILVKDRFQARSLEEFLRKYNIPIISNAKMSIHESLIFQFLEVFFLYLSTPDKLNKLKQLLFMGVVTSSSDFNSLDLSDSIFQECVSFCKQCKITFQEEGLAALLRKLYEQPFAKGFLSLAEAVVSYDNFDYYNDLMQIFQLLIENEWKFSDGIDEICLFFEKIRQSNIKQNKLYFKKPSKEGSCATLMTTFNSKGLEFDIVFALGLCSRQSKKESFFYSLEKKEVLFVEEHPQEYQRFLLDKEQEKLRLLYVALTRAKKRVYVPFIFCEEEPHAYSLGQLSALDLFYSFLLSSTDSIKEAYENFSKVSFRGLKEFLVAQTQFMSYEVIENYETLTPYQEVHKQPIIEPPKAIQATLMPKKQFSFSSLTRSIVSSKKMIETDLPSGTEVGNLFHAILEKIIQNGWLVKRYKEYREHLIKKILYGTCLEQYFEKVLWIINETIEKPLFDNFALSDVNPSTMIQELEFYFRLNQQDHMKGFIDLVFQHNNRYYIVDWKTNILVNYTIHEIEKEMEHHHYFVQGAVYEEALKRYHSFYDKGLTFGGIYYVFLRAPYAYHFYPNPDLLKSALCKLNINL